MNIESVLVRVFITNGDMDQAVSFYERLTAQKVTARFRYGALEVAGVGKFLLIAGSDEATAPLRDTTGTIRVDDLDAFKAMLVEAGSHVLIPPQTVPTGRNMVVRHPDGAVFEYVEHTR